MSKCPVNPVNGNLLSRVQQIRALSVTISAPRLYIRLDYNLHNPNNRKSDKRRCRLSQNRK